MKNTTDAASPLDIPVSRVCPECGSTDTEWHCTQINRSSVVDGRLRMHDVSTVFFLGCNDCSETIKTVPGDDVARWMTGTANAPLIGALAHPNRADC